MSLRWRLGDLVTVRGDGDRTATVQGRVEAIRRDGCGSGMYRLRLRGVGEVLADEDDVEVAEPLKQRANVTK